MGFTTVALRPHRWCCQSSWFLVLVPICPVVLKLWTSWHFGTICICAEVGNRAIHEVHAIEEVHHCRRWGEGRTGKVTTFTRSHNPVSSWCLCRSTTLSSSYTCTKVNMSTKHYYIDKVSQSSQMIKEYIPKLRYMQEYVPELICDPVHGDHVRTRHA